jgi:hypothetical protein
VLVATRDGAAAGRIDAVVAGPDGPVIRDYKSGAVFETTLGGNTIVKDEYAIQLRLYAAIYASMTGHWPARLEVVPLVGDPVNVPFDPADCDRLLREAIARRDEVNATVNLPMSLESRIDQLAAPSPAACAYCTYRPHCQPYLNALQSQPNPAWPNDAIGHLKEMRVLGNSRRALTLSKDGATVWIRGIDPEPERHPALEVVVPGDMVGAFNLRRDGGGASFVQGPFTVFYKLAAMVGENGRRVSPD